MFLFLHIVIFISCIALFSLMFCMHGPFAVNSDVHLQRLSCFSLSSIINIGGSEGFNQASKHRGSLAVEVLYMTT